MKRPTRIHKGRRQVLYDGIWCDVPYGFREQDMDQYTSKATRVYNAKRLLLDEPSVPFYGDSATGRIHTMRAMFADEWAKVMQKQIDNAILSTYRRYFLLGDTDGPVPEAPKAHR